MKIKSKKLLTSTVLTSFTTASVLTSIFTLSACGGNSTENIFYQNYIQYKNAIYRYNTKVKSMTLTDLLVEMYHINEHLQELCRNLSAFEGLSEIADFSPSTVVPSNFGKCAAKITLNKGKTIEDVYDFFASRVSYYFFPTYQNFVVHVNSPSSSIHKLIKEASNKNDTLFNIFIFFYLFNKAIFFIHKAIIINSKALDNMTIVTEVQNYAIIKSIVSSQFWQILYYITKKCVNEITNISPSITNLYNFIQTDITNLCNKCKSLEIPFLEIDFNKL